MRRTVFFPSPYWLWAVCFVLSLVGPSSQAAEPGITLYVPEGARAARVFDDSRTTLPEEYATKAMAHFVPGSYSLPLTPGTYPLTLFARVEYGPGREMSLASEPGTVTVSKPSPDWLDYTITQKFVYADKTLTLTIDYLGTPIIDGVAESREYTVNEPFLTDTLYLTGMVEKDGQQEYLRFSSEDYASLPLYLFQVNLEGDQEIQLYVRWQPPMAGSGPANVVYADVRIDEGQRIQTGYWNLVYSAVHHNWDEKFWVLFDQPLGDAYGVAVFTRNVHDVEPQEVYTLDQNLNRLRTIPLEKISKTPAESLPQPSHAKAWSLY